MGLICRCKAWAGSGWHYTMAVEWPVQKGFIGHSTVLHTDPFTCPVRGGNIWSSSQGQSWNLKPQSVTGFILDEG